ncbi:hypothetical protein L596_013503 [Steinernema carpocapsae]|uniref:Uncharacterized protein n=1 Tax=Steinernema carpocapsae TaxID=34508 RepID=A0A4V6A536_STECR|nr:hypothetical protein L596_013503 [Steinernema carpocapsae]
MLFILQPPTKSNFASSFVVFVQNLALIDELPLALNGSKTKTNSRRIVTPSGGSRCFSGVPNVIRDQLSPIGPCRLVLAILGATHPVMNDDAALDAITTAHQIRDQLD